MNDKQNKNNGLIPKLPSPDAMWASWSVFLGSMGLVGNFCCAPIWSLPAGLYMGLIGIAFAFLSKKGKPMTQQAQLGLILSVLAAVCGLLMTLFIIFAFRLMETDTIIGSYLRQYMELLSSPMPTQPTPPKPMP